MGELLTLVDSLLAGEAWSKERLLHLRAIALDEQAEQPEPVSLDTQDTVAQEAIRSITEQQFQKTAPTTSHTTVITADHPVLAAALREPQFDCRELQQATGGRALSSLLTHLLTQNPSMCRNKVDALAREIEMSYMEHPYHNSTHATCVLHAVHHLLVTAGVLDTLDGDRSLIALAAYLAAAAHDMRHPGVNNSMLVNVNADLALTHNDQSVCENHHLCELFKLLQQPHLNVLAVLDPTAYRFVRSSMIHMVLKTDMQQHNQTIREAKEAHVAGKMAPQLTMQLVLKVADLSHATYPWAVHRAWVEGIEQEFFQQGDLERQAGVPVSPLMDRQRPGVQKTQVAFLGVVVQPLIALFVTIYPSAEYLQHGLQLNMQAWHNNSR